MTSADLSGRASGYRGVAIRCPGCAEQMRQLSLEKAEAEVDVCDGCGGIWVDWFDGEVRAIATETLRTSEMPAVTPPKKTDDNKSGDETKKKDDKDSGRPSRNEALAVGACPRCAKQLVPERYAVKAEFASHRIEGRVSMVAGTTGAELLRCEDCMGSFVTRSSAEVLSWLSTQSDEAPPSQTAIPSLKPVPWDRFVGLLKTIIGGLKKPDAKKPDAKKP